MTLTWKIDHDARRVEAVAQGTLTVNDVREYLERIAEAGAMPYAKLFDISDAATKLGVDELKGLGASIREFAVDGAAATGPLAIVIGHSGQHLQAAHYADAAGGTRPLQIFRSRAEADRWLADMGKRGPRGRR